MKKHIFMLCTLVTSCIVFTSCAPTAGIDIGFNRRSGRLPEVYFGVKSDKTEFKLDDVTLDFSYGSDTEIGGYIGNYIEGADYFEDCPIVCVGVYFFNTKPQNILTLFNEAGFADYQEIEDMQFIKEISLEDYNTNYKVENKFFGVEYQHTETFTIPEEVMELSIGYVALGVFQIAYIPSENNYRLAGGGYQVLKYEKMDGDMVKISPPDGNHYSDPQP